MRRRTLRRALAGAIAIGLSAPSVADAAVADDPFARGAAQQIAAAAAVPSQFQDTLAFGGLTNPVSIRFAPDGAVFVAEKRGTVQRFDALDDPTPTQVVDVRGQVHDYWDRGLIGLAIDPAYPARPYLYLSYTYDKDNSFGDTCGDATGALGCVVKGRIARVNANTGTETVLVEDFCQQYPSHSVGGLVFGADGSLYASAGDGASFNYADERPKPGRTENPCDDPSLEGGSIRSQDLRTSGDPLGLDGSILRLDPDVPLAGTDAARTAAMVAHGLRNPFRLAVRPGTNEVWAADVGWNQWEEIDRLQTPGAGVRNFGWPCYEGAGRMGTWDGLNNPVCEGLYAEGAAAHATPYYAYDHGAKVVAGESCAQGTSSISGLDFYDGGTFPPEYDGALFFADYARQCAWAMLRGADGLPDPANLRTFITGAAVVDLQVGPGGDLFYVDIAGQSVRRVRATAGNRAPTARLQATPDRGPLPLAVALDGSGSTDPDATALTYAWDTDLDGFDDGTGAQLAAQFTTSGERRVRLRVTDPSGLSDIAETTIYAGVPPTAAIATPAAGTTWKVGDPLSFTGSGASADGTPLPATALRWRLDLHHCPLGGCHVHPIETWSGTAGGSFNAPDHEYPSWLELRLTATDGGLETSVTRALQPRTSRLRVASEPAGLTVFSGAVSGPSPLESDVIVGSTNTIGAETPQPSGGRSWAFTGWPEPGTSSREVVAGPGDATFTLHFAAGAPLPTPAPGPAPAPTPGPQPEPEPAPAPVPVAAWSFDAGGDRVGRDVSGHGHDLRLRGDARRTARGHRGGGLRLDGRGDSAVLAATGDARLRDAFTVSAWVRPARRAADASVLAGERRGATAFALGVRRGGGSWRGGLRRDARMRPGRWSHLALRWDGAALTLFVGGREAGAPRPVPAGRIGKLLRLRLGGDLAGRRLRGRLDDVRIYDRALDAPAIAADRDRAVGG